MLSGNKIASEYDEDDEEQSLKSPGLKSLMKAKKGDLDPNQVRAELK